MFRLLPARISRLGALFLLLVGMLNVGGVAQAAPRPRLSAQSGPVTLTGTVAVRPQYTEITPFVRTPRAFMMILDTSRSMSWNFAGQGTRNGNTVQCGPTSDPAVVRKHCAAGAPWQVAEERRITIAKTAIAGLIDQMDANDTMRLMAYNTANIRSNTKWVFGTPAGKNALKKSLLNLGKYEGDPYRTRGQVPTASALYQARQLMATQPVTAPNTLEYEPLAILLTGSVANSFLVGDGDWDYNEATDNCPNAPFPEDTPSCHLGFVGGKPRPITAMLMQAQLLKQLTPLYMVAMAGVDQTGLQNVASSPVYPFFIDASQPADVQAGLQEIVDSTTEISGGECIPHGGDVWFDSIDAAHLPAPMPAPPINGQIVGYVTLRDQQGAPLPNGQGQAPVLRDPLTGEISYTFTNLVPGIYQVQAFTAYKGDDQVTRIYNMLFDPTADGDVPFRYVTVAPNATGVVYDNLLLNLQGEVCP